MRTVLAMCVCLVPALAVAQDLSPRAYFPTPVSSNAVILTYTHLSGDIVFDPTAPVSDAKSAIHAPSVSYYRAFSFFGRSANVTGVLPFAAGNATGVVNGVARAIHREGMADAVARLAVNLHGGPARTASEFGRAGPFKSVLGVSLRAVMPTGQYDPALLINLGSNRWAFKPEFGYARRVKALIVEGFAGVWLFTENDTFYAGAAATTRRRTQEPIGALELHVSYDVNPRLWISADINYWYGGRFSIDGERNSLTRLSNSRLGVTASVPIHGRQSLKVSFSNGVVARFGGNFRIVSAGWQYTWLSRR